jgi:hypothetical protein
VLDAGCRHAALYELPIALCLVLIDAGIHYSPGAECGRSSGTWNRTAGTWASPSARGSTGGRKSDAPHRSSTSALLLCTHYHNINNTASPKQSHHQQINTTLTTPRPSLSYYHHINNISSPSHRKTHESGGRWW